MTITYMATFQIEYSKEQECIIETDDPEGGWVDTHHYDSSIGGIEERVTEMTLDETQLSQSIGAEESNGDDEDDDEEDAADMEAFEVSGMLDEQDKVFLFSRIYVTYLRK